MLIPLFKYLESLDVPGSLMFNYIMFRSAMAAMTALLFATIIGKKVIFMLQRQQIGEDLRDLGLEGQNTYNGWDYYPVLNPPTDTSICKTRQYLYPFDDHYYRMAWNDRIC